VDGTYLWEDYVDHSAGDYNYFLGGLLAEVHHDLWMPKR
jgi:hypothetical protein